MKKQYMRPCAECIELFVEGHFMENSEIDMGKNDGNADGILSKKKENSGTIWKNGSQPIWGDK